MIGQLSVENSILKKVLRIMRESDLLCVVKKRRWINVTSSNHSYPRYPNLVKGLSISELNQVWFSNITYIRILEDFVFLSVILDGFSRKVIGYSISKKLDTSLSLEALKMAIDQRNPKPGSIHHWVIYLRRSLNYHLEKGSEIMPLSIYNYLCVQSMVFIPKSFLKLIRYEVFCR